MIFYRYFAGQGREALIDALASADPFALCPTEIVERVVALSHGTNVTKLRREMWSTIGRVFEIQREPESRTGIRS